MTTEQKENSSPKRLTGELKAWLRGRKGWNHDEWLALLADLRSKGFIAFTESPEGRDSIGVFLSAYLPVVTQLVESSPQELKKDGKSREKSDLHSDRNKRREVTGQTDECCPDGSVAVLPEEAEGRVKIDAVMWYRQSAGHGLASNRNGMEYCHEHGDDAAEGRVNAVKWFLN